MGRGEDYENSDQGSRSSSDVKLKYEIVSVNGESGVGDDDQPRNKRVGPRKKARRFTLEPSADIANVGSDYGSTALSL